MSLHADTAVPARDRKRLERLCRHAARSLLAIGRLEAMAGGGLAYRLKNRWRDGTTHVVMERHELLERLAPLIPPPRAYQVRYHGELAPCASGPGLEWFGILWNEFRILRCLALPARAPPLASFRDGAGHSDSTGDVSFGGISEFDFDRSQSFGDCENSV